MKKYGWLAAVLLAGMPLAVSSAPADTAGRSAQMKKVRDQLNDQDPFIRLSALEEAVKSKDATIRDLAIKQALSSKDEDLRASAFKAFMSSVSVLTLNLSEPKASVPASKKDFNLELHPLSQKLSQVLIQKFNAETGEFTMYSATTSSAGYPGQVVGTTVSGSIYLGSVGQTCRVDVRLGEGVNLVGTVECGMDGGFVQATATRQIY